MSMAVLSQMNPAGNIMDTARVIGKSAVSGPPKQKV